MSDNTIMAGQLTGKKYDQCAIDQQTARFTHPTQHFMDLNRYVNCGNQSHLDPSTIVGVESCLRGNELKATDCTKGTLNCLVDAPLDGYLQQRPNNQVHDSGLRNPQAPSCAPIPQFTWPADGKADLRNLIQQPTRQPVQVSTPVMQVHTMPPSTSPVPVSTPVLQVHTMPPTASTIPVSTPVMQLHTMPPSTSPVPVSTPVLQTHTFSRAPKDPLQSLAPIGDQVEQVTAPIARQVQQSAAPIARQVQQSTTPISQGLKNIFGGNGQGLFSGLFGGVAKGNVQKPVYGPHYGGMGTASISVPRPSTVSRPVYGPLNGGVGTTNVHTPQIGNANVYHPPNTQLGNANVYQPDNMRLGNSNLKTFSDSAYDSSTPRYQGIDLSGPQMAPLTRQ